MTKAAVDLEKGEAIILDNDEIWIVEDINNPSGLRVGGILSLYLTLRNLKTGEVGKYSSTPVYQYDTVDLGIISAAFRYCDGDYFFEDLATGDLVVLDEDMVEDSVGSVEDDYIYDIYMRNEEPYWITVSKDFEKKQNNDDRQTSRADETAKGPIMKEAKDLIKGDYVVLNTDEIWTVEDRIDLQGGLARNIPFVRLSLRKLMTGEMTEYYLKAEEQLELAEPRLLTAEFIGFDGETYFFEELETGDLIMLKSYQVSDSIGIPEEILTCDIYEWDWEPYYYCAGVSQRFDNDDQEISRGDGKTDEQEARIPSDKRQDITTDAAQAEEWYQKGDEQLNYGNREAAAEYFLKAAEAGHTKAQNTLGFCYWRGWGVEKDNERAFYWYSKAAEQGDLQGQSNMGYSYKTGEGVEKDPAMAFYWYSKAAKQGDKTAQGNLGAFYEHGDGVEKDIEKAIYWYTKAAEQGDAKSQRRLEELKG